MLFRYPIDQLLKFHQCIYVWIFKNLRFTSFDFKSLKHGALTSQGFNRLEIKKDALYFIYRVYFSFFELKNKCDNGGDARCIEIHSVLSSSKFISQKLDRLQNIINGSEITGKTSLPCVSARIWP